MKQLKNNQPNIILASTSPFRNELMQKLMVNFKAEKPLVNEESLKQDFKKDPHHKPKELCSFLADKKAFSISKDKPGFIVIGSDQSLFLEEKTFDKPGSEENAINQLLCFSGRTGELITSTSIHYQNQKINFNNSTKLHFKDLTKEQITNYIKHDQPLNCAGSFMFEKKGIFLFKEIECSDPTSIQGLPLMQLSIELGKLGVNLPFI